MAITVKHKFVSAIPDAGDTTIVQPSNWNDTHDLTGFGTAATLDAGVANGVATLDSSGTVPLSQIPALGDLNYQGTWNANTNSPTLTSSVGTKGYYYVVSVAGTTNLNGITDWQIGDWAVFNGSVWQKIDNTDAVTSVNGYTGTVVLTAADVSAVPYTGATGAVDLNNKSLTDISHLGINTTTVPDILLRAFGDNNATSRIGIRGYSSDANSSSMRVAKFRGTYASPQAPLSGDSLGKFELAGYGTTSSSGYPQASVEGVATENWGATARGTKALVKVTPNTTTTQVTALTIDQDSKATFASTVTANGTLLTGNTGTVTSVGGTGTVSGINLSGTVTSSGNLTLGGTLDLSSPPTIGNTAPNTGKFTTLESTGTASLGTTSTTYVQIVGDASYPMVKAAGGTNTPLVLSPLGTGALQAQKTDSTATGGNARGANAVDWSTSRGGAIYVASGAQAVLGGGFNNSASGSTSVVGGGQSNTSGGASSVIGGGYGNQSSGNLSTISGGHINASTGFLNFIGGGESNSGTANGTVTTQATTTVTSGSTAVTLSGSNASIKVGQLVTGTGIQSLSGSLPYTYVAAISGTSLTLSQNASASGSPTLSFYTPHGVVVGGGNNQATGSYSFIGGGGDAGTAANRNVASGDWSFVGGGTKNTASNAGAVVGGGGTNGVGFVSGNTASGKSSFIGSGYTNIASGEASCVLGGEANQATAYGSSVLGGHYGTTRAISGNIVSPACDVPVAGALGVSQSALLILGTQTTDATATVLRSNTAAASTTNQVILPNNSAYYFKATVIANVTGGGNTKAWTLEGAIKRGSGVGTAAIVGTVTTTIVAADLGAATWTVTATADTTNGGLAITFTGQASTTIRVVARVDTTEVTF